ncbi:MAG TPA: hypothetical protein VMS99_18215 [Acidimicrobiia bacterium]|nr:hypothetical protein [Acidimicrobiia bacterium]
MRVVEFLGVPGSGKTTLAGEMARSVPGTVDLEEAVRSSIEARGEDAVARTVARISRSSSSRIWRAAYARSTDRFSGLTRFLGAYPDVMRTILEGQQARAGRDRGQDLVLGWLLNLMARYQLAVEWARADWLAVDEGFCQRGVALFSHGFDPSDQPHLDSYLGSIPQPDAVVVVDTPPQIAEARLDSRGWSERVRDLPIEERRAFLAGAGEVTRAIADRLETAGTPLIWVDGTTPVADSLRVVAATLPS